MSLSQFFGIFLARRWMLISAVCASFLGAMLIVAVMPPRYTASTRVMLDVIKPDPVSGTVMANQFLRAYTKTQTELIRDYKVAGPVVDELGWSRDPTMIARYEAPGDPNAARRRMAQLIINKTEAKLIEGSNILEITYTAWSPDGAKTVADAILRSYVDATLSFKRESARQTGDWYQIQAEKAQRLLALAEEQKSNFERTHGLILQADKSDVDSTRLNALSGQPAPASSGSGMPIASPAISATFTQLAQLDAQIAQARQNLGPNHPALREAQQRRALLATQAEQERAASNTAIAAARRASETAGSASLVNQRALDVQRARVLANRDKLSSLRQLQDEVDLRRDQYIRASTKVAELRLQGDITDAGLTLLGNAVAPEDPSFPNVPLIVIGSLAFGLVLGVLAALLTEMLNRRVRSWRDLEAAAENVPLLAIVSAARPENLQKNWIQTIAKKLTPWPQKALRA